MKKISKIKKILFMFIIKKQITSSLSDGDIRRHLLKMEVLMILYIYVAIKTLNL